MLRRIHHAAIICSDYDRSRDFYTRILGLRIIAENVYDLAEAQSRFAQHLALTLTDSSDVARLKHLLQPFAGSGACPLRFRYSGSQARCELDAGDDWRVLLSDPLLDSLRALLGEKAVEVVM